jgi:hypothetical protein
MLIGLDLDNTLIDWQPVFVEVARELGLPLVASSRLDLRGKVRQLPGGEQLWQCMQAEVYATRAESPSPFPGALEFVRKARRRGHTLTIVSHKTERARRDPVQRPLRLLAMAWLGSHGFVSERQGVPRDKVFFAESRALKLQRIASLHCDAFVDDLPEVLSDPAFPVPSRRVLFGPDAGPIPPGVVRAPSWADVATELLSAS